MVLLWLHNHSSLGFTTVSALTCHSLVMLRLTSGAVASFFNLFPIDKMDAIFAVVCRQASSVYPGAALEVKGESSPRSFAAAVPQALQVAVRPKTRKAKCMLLDWRIVKTACGERPPCQQTQ